MVLLDSALWLPLSPEEQANAIQSIAFHLGGIFSDEDWNTDAINSTMPRLHNLFQEIGERLPSDETWGFLLFWDTILGPSGSNLSPQVMPSITIWLRQSLASPSILLQESALEALPKLAPALARELAIEALPSLSGRPELIQRAKEMIDEP